MRWADTWKVLFVPVLTFFLGAAIVLNDIILTPPIDVTTSVFGGVLMGLGPALGYDRVDRAIDAFKGTTKE